MFFRTKQDLQIAAVVDPWPVMEFKSTNPPELRSADPLQLLQMNRSADHRSQARCSGRTIGRDAVTRGAGTDRHGTEPSFQRQSLDGLHRTLGGTVDVGHSVVGDHHG